MDIKFSPYSEAEDNRIRRYYRAGQEVFEASKVMGRSPWGVAQRAADIGLGRLWVRDMKKLAERERRAELARTAVDHDTEVGDLCSHFRLTASYRNDRSEIQERAFYHDEAETVSAAAALPPALMGAPLAWRSVSQRKYLGGGAWIWEDASRLIAQ